jgi:hypothetical protein
MNGICAVFSPLALSLDVVTSALTYFIILYSTPLPPPTPHSSARSLMILNVNEGRIPLGVCFHFISTSFFFLSRSSLRSLGFCHGTVSGFDSKKKRSSECG